MIWILIIGLVVYWLYSCNIWTWLNDKYWELLVDKYFWESNKDKKDDSSNN